MERAIGANGAIGIGIEKSEQVRAAFLARAAEEAFAALMGPELGPEVGQVDHDGPEREALAAHYAGPEAVSKQPSGVVNEDWAEMDAWLRGCAMACSMRGER
jgi:hypothetical protein